jgi:hypothetical protein
MSSDHGQAAAPAHHDADHDAFDPEPVQQLSAEETPSPGWLPVAGGIAFLVAAVWFFYPDAGAPTRAPAVPSAPAATAAAAAPAARPPAAATGRPRPTSAAEGRRRLDLKALPARKNPAAPAR